MNNTSLRFLYSRQSIYIDLAILLSLIFKADWSESIMIDDDRGGDVMDCTQGIGNFIKVTYNCRAQPFVKGWNKLLISRCFYCIF